MKRREFNKIGDSSNDNFKFKVEERKAKGRVFMRRSERECEFVRKWFEGNHVSAWSRSWDDPQASTNLLAAWTPTRCMNSIPLSTTFPRSLTKLRLQWRIEELIAQTRCQCRPLSPHSCLVASSTNRSSSNFSFVYVTASQFGDDSLSKYVIFLLVELFKREIFVEKEMRRKQNGTNAATNNVFFPTLASFLMKNCTMEHFRD